jgi:hypothetical protein
LTLECKEHSGHHPMASGAIYTPGECHPGIGLKNKDHPGSTAEHSTTLERQIPHLFPVLKAAAQHHFKSLSCDFYTGNFESLVTRMQRRALGTDTSEAHHHSPGYSELRRDPTAFVADQYMILHWQCCLWRLGKQSP